MRVYVHSTIDDLADAVSALLTIGADAMEEKQAAEAIPRGGISKGTLADVKT